MQGNFEFHNPTKLYFGKESINKLRKELIDFGPKVLLVYGKQSIKKIGLYDKVINICKLANKKITEINGVMPNPTYEKLLSGLKIARKFKPDLILAIGGGSVIDYCKALSASIYAKGNVWERYWVKGLEPLPNWKITPIGTILTMVGTGSEMNGGCVITNTALGKKSGKHFTTTKLFPKFTILNPELTYSIPYKQMVSGIFDIFAHLCEQYFSNKDDNTSDYLSEGLMRSVIANSKIAIKKPKDYSARSNLMWSATWALNTLLRKGKIQDWTPHKIGQAIGALTDATHGLCLAAIYPAYHTYIMNYGLDKYVRFAKYVWDIETKNKTKTQIAKDGIKAMVNWMKILKVDISLKQLGVNKEMIKTISQTVAVQKGCYRKLTKKDIEIILIRSLNKK